MVAVLKINKNKMKSLSQHLNESLSFETLFDKIVNMHNGISAHFEITKYPSGYISYKVEISVNNAYKGSFNNTVGEDTSSNNTSVYMKFWSSGNASSATKISHYDNDKFIELFENALSKTETLPGAEKDKLRKVFKESAVIFEKSRMSK